MSAHAGPAKAGPYERSAKAGPYEKGVGGEVISKTFGPTVAVDKVSFEVENGELFGFIGPDGGGKTTLFRILVSLLVPSGGRATVIGLDVVRDFRALRQRV